MNAINAHLPSPSTLPGSPRRAFAACILAAASLLFGCVSDATLLRENAAVALRSARIQARSDLRCPGADVTVESEQEVSGAPWGYLYSDYRIYAEGCGRSTFYDVECRDEKLCKVTRTPR